MHRRGGGGGQGRRHGKGHIDTDWHVSTDAFLGCDLSNLVSLSCQQLPLGRESRVHSGGGGKAHAASRPCHACVTRRAGSEVACLAGHTTEAGWGGFKLSNVASLGC